MISKVFWTSLHSQQMGVAIGKHPLFFSYYSIHMRLIHKLVSILNKPFHICDYQQKPPLDRCIVQPILVWLFYRTGTGRQGLSLEKYRGIKQKRLRSSTMQKGNKISRLSRKLQLANRGPDLKQKKILGYCVTECKIN